MVLFKVCELSCLSGGGGGERVCAGGGGGGEPKQCLFYEGYPVPVSCAFRGVKVDRFKAALRLDPV